MENSENDKHVSVHFVRCLKCGKILKCSRFDTAALLRHIETDHPELVVSSKSHPDNLSPNAQENDCDNRLQNTDSNIQSPHLVNRQKPCQDDGSHPPSTEHSSSQNEKDSDYKQTHYIVKSEKYEAVNPDNNTCDTKNNDKGLSNVIYTRRYKINAPKNKKTLYRTSIEKWRPVNGTIYCPNCGQTKRPLIRTRAERLTYNSCGACCLLGCWPFCFLPCLFPVHNLEYLHCANCKTFLGLYDRACNCIKPNRHFVGGCEGSDSSAQEQTNPSDGDNGEYVTKESKSTTEVEEAESNQKQDTLHSSKGEENLPSIVINGRQLDRETVTKIKKLSRFSTLAGINLKELTEMPPQQTAFSTQESRLQSSAIRSMHTSDSSATNINMNNISTQPSVTSDSTNYKLPNHKQKNSAHSDPVGRKKNCNDSKSPFNK